MNINILRGEVKLPIVERDLIIKIINNQYREILFQNKNEKKNALINICGQGGMGKTYIAENIKSEYKHFIYYDLEQYQNHISDISDILVAIASSTKEIGFKFNLFVIAYKMYLEKRKKYIGPSFDFEASKIPVGDIGSLFLDAISISHPLASVVADSGLIIGKRLGLPEKVMNLFSGRKKKVLQELEKCSTVNQLEDFLLGFFIQEMNENLSRIEEPLVIFIDTYESYFGNISYKMLKREECVKDLVQSINNVVWVIGGRKPLEWGIGKTLYVDRIKNDESFTKIFEHVELQNLVHREYIKNETGGYPEYLYQFIIEYNQKKDNPKFKIQDLEGGLDGLIQRICHDLDAMEKNLLFNLCKIGYWNDKSQSMIEDVLYDFDASEMQYRKLSKLGFVINDHVDKNVRNVILKDISVIDLKNLYRKYINKIEIEGCLHKEFYQNLADSLLITILSKDRKQIIEYKETIHQKLMKLLDILEDNTEAFESYFFDLWDFFKDSEFNDELSAAFMILYRKYLILVGDLKGVNDSITPEREGNINLAVQNNRRVFWESAIIYMKSNLGLNQFVTQYHLPILRDTIDSQNRDDVIQYVYASMLNCYNYDDRQNLDGLLQMYSLYLRDYVILGSKEYFQMSLLAFKTVVKLEVLHKVPNNNSIVNPERLFREAQIQLGKNHPITAEILQYCIAENYGFVSLGDVKEQYEFYEELYGNNHITQRWKYWYANCLFCEKRDDKEIWGSFNKTAIRLLEELDEWSENNGQKTDWHTSVLFSLYQYYFITGDDDKTKDAKKRYHKIIKDSPYFDIHLEQFGQLEDMLNGYRRFGPM